MTGLVQICRVQLEPLTRSAALYETLELFDSEFLIGNDAFQQVAD